MIALLKGIIVFLLASLSWTVWNTLAWTPPPHQLCSTFPASNRLIDWTCLVYFNTKENNHCSFHHFSHHWSLSHYVSSAVDELSGLAELSAVKTTAIFWFKILSLSLDYYRPVWPLAAIKLRRPHHLLPVSFLFKSWKSVSTGSLVQNLASVPPVWPNLWPALGAHKVHQKYLNLIQQVMLNLGSSELVDSFSIKFPEMLLYHHILILYY